MYHAKIRAKIGVALESAILKKISYFWFVFFVVILF